MVKKRRLKLLQLLRIKKDERNKLPLKKTYAKSKESRIQKQKDLRDCVTDIAGGLNIAGVFAVQVLDRRD